MTVDWMKAVKEQEPGALPGGQAGGVRRRPWEAGQDRISRGAPCAIQAWAPKDERTAPPAAMIAIHQIQLAAPALGLGTTFTGSINTASQAYPPLIEALGIPAGYMAHGTSVIGYPAEKYQRVPARKPSDVIWH